MLSDYLKSELRSAWSGVFLDGRNEHGAHVLPLLERGGGPDDITEEMLSDYADEIMTAAESAGHIAGDAVIICWRYAGEEGGFEVSIPYHADLTSVFYGTAYEQKRERDIDEARAEASAARWL